LCLSTGNRRNQFGKKMALLSQRQFSLGAPDCPVVHRTVSGAPGWLWRTGCSRVSSVVYDYKSPDCSVVHRTVRWCTRLSGEPTVCRANGRPRNPRVTRGRANGMKEAPDCPVCTGQCPVRQRLQIANGRLRQNRKEIRTGLSDASVDRRQDLPSWNALNGS
jgi:hypothetical protein